MRIGAARAGQTGDDFDDLRISRESHGTGHCQDAETKRKEQSFHTGYLSQTGLQCQTPSTGTCLRHVAFFRSENVHDGMAGFPQFVDELVDFFTLHAGDRQPSIVFVKR